MYTKEQFAITKAENPNDLPRDIIRKMGEKWNNLSMDQKEIYYKKYEEMKVKYNAEVLATAYEGYKILLNKGVKFVQDMPAHNMNDFESLWKTLTKTKRKHLLNAVLEKEEK